MESSVSENATTFLVCSNPSSIKALCIGSGRFLRSVLVPALVYSNFPTAIFQTRGRSFLDYTLANNANVVNTKDDVNSKINDIPPFFYEVDTVEQDGTVHTERVPYMAAGTFGSLKGKQEILNLISNQICHLQIIGVGITEAGLSHVTNAAIQDLALVLQACHYRRRYCESTPSQPGKICIINTDNVPGNGSLLKNYMIQIAQEQEEIQGQDSKKDNQSSFLQFLKDEVSFHDTMVDRITSQRDGSNGLIPRAEPIPTKALVIEDLEGNLPPNFNSNNVPDLRAKFGLVVRTQENQLERDIALKLRVANGTHTAIAHVMALTQLLMTDELSDKPLSSSFNKALLSYLDSFFQDQILIGAHGLFVNDSDREGGREADKEIRLVYEDWRRRLIHAHFGLSTFFITQNGAAKGGIRISPTVKDLIESGKKVTCTSVFAYAAILRFLTPAVPVSIRADNGIFRGWLDKATRENVYNNGNDSNDSCENIMYADGLSYNLKRGWYEFRCDLKIKMPNQSIKSLSEALACCASPQQPCYYGDVISSYLRHPNGGDLSIIANNPATKEAFSTLVKSIATLYARMVAGDGMLDILKEMVDGSHIYEKDGLSTKYEALVDGIGIDACKSSKPLHFRESPIPSDSRLLKAKMGNGPVETKLTVYSEVASANIIDLHTHLLPPSHGILCLWGIDELLTYHYLVAEYFMTAPATLSPAEFFSYSKQKQADMIWKALFIDRSPISEACRGVLSTLTALGLERLVEIRDLENIRDYFTNFRKEGEIGAEKYCDLVRQLAGIRYTVMTNIPFDPTESKHWTPKPKGYSSMFRSALRVDPLLTGDRETIEKALSASGYEKTLNGARQYLNDWCDIMKPEYMMASTPHNFTIPREKGVLAGVKKKGVNEEAMKQPFAFVDLNTSSNKCVQDCDGEEDDVGTLIDEKSDFLREVLIKVCEERDLPIALKIGAHRGVNPALLQAGDGIVAFADAEILARLCSRFPKVRFLATFLSRNNQHEACVLASKFRNLHIYGCWWFCNNPSIIQDITQMRLEMLGTAFTAQHSDARVVDQLIYKWSHSRAIIADVLSKEYDKVSESGWVLTRGEVRRDIERLFGTSYEEFMAKSFST